MEIEVSVNGKGQSFKATMNVDPKDTFEQTMLKRTHFWTRIMRGSNKYLVIVSNKHSEEFPIGPEDYNKEFHALGIYDKAQVVLYDSRIMDMEDSSDEEEGEDEHDEMDEQEQ